VVGLPILGYKSSGTLVNSSISSFVILLISSLLLSPRSAPGSRRRENRIKLIGHGVNVVRSVVDLAGRLKPSEVYLPRRLRERGKPTGSPLSRSELYNGRL
jgi:hypothetical protein